MDNLTQYLPILMSLVSFLMEVIKVLLQSLIAGFWVYLCSILLFVHFSRYPSDLDVECECQPLLQDLNKIKYFSFLVQSKNFNDLNVCDGCCKTLLSLYI